MSKELKPTVPKELKQTMSKELKPTLGTGAPRVRKRNVQTKLDPETFRNDLIAILEAEDAEDDIILLQNLSADSLDYTRYGEVFCEILIAGNIVQPGGALRDEPTRCCMFREETTEGIDRWTDILHQMVRRKPFLRTRLDDVMKKLLLCLNGFSEVERKRLAIATAGMLAKVILSPIVLKKLLMEGTIEAGLSLGFITELIQSYLKREAEELGVDVGKVGVDRMMGVLKSAGIDTGTMVSMMPGKERSADKLSEHFSELGLVKLVEVNESRIKEDKIGMVKDGIAGWIKGTGANAGLPSDEMVQWVDRTRQDIGLGSREMVVAVWDGVAAGITLGRKGLENRKAVLKAVAKAHEVLMDVCSGGNEELELVKRIQSFVSADMELLKVGVFLDVVYMLYWKNVLAEDTVLRWYRRSSRLTKGSAASSNIIREQMAPMVKWLETAEVETEEAGENGEHKPAASTVEASA